MSTVVRVLLHYTDVLLAGMRDIPLDNALFVWVFVKIGKLI